MADVDDQHEFITERAVFSEDRRYRYSLTRPIATTPGSPALFIMLNPSTADEVQLDPTVSKCLRLATRWGYQTLMVANIFAFRATDPTDMKAEPLPVGARNDDAIKIMAEYAVRMNGIVVCAWGNHAQHLNRGLLVRRMLLDRRLDHYHLGQTMHGHPKHPLARGKHHVAEDIQPELWL